MFEEKNKDTTFIYGLWDTDYNLRYIGKANDPKRRLYAHMSEAKRGVKNYKAAWIRHLLSKNEIPYMEILDECPKSEWKEVEQQWIVEAKKNGLKLVNLTDGGEGNSGWSGWNKGLPCPEETKKKISKANAGQKRSDETKRKISKALKGRKGHIKTKEEREAISKRLMGNTYTLGYKHTEETKRKMSESSKGQIVSLETREKLSKVLTGRKFSKKHRENLSISHKAMVPWNKGLCHKELTRRKISICNKMFQANHMNDLNKLKTLQKEYFSLYGYYNKKYGGFDGI